VREIRFIVLHCTASPQRQTVAEIQRYWRDVMKWRRPGYHRIIEANGNVVSLEDYATPTNGVAGQNSHSIHICYIGGIDAKGQPSDNRTIAQRSSMLNLVKEARQLFPKAKICGHRDFPGVKKACPSFDVSKWLKDNGIN
jgi:N-acetylmuramoyl-L-alanine amidase